MSETNKKTIKENSENENTKEDTEERGYYYDDSTGYEIYNPDDEEEDSDEDKEDE